MIATLNVGRLILLAVLHVDQRILLMRLLNLHTKLISLHTIWSEIN